MALFKNLYLDLGFLNPFKKKEKAPVPTAQFRELPAVSRRLIEPKEEPTISLPPIKPLNPPPKIEPVPQKPVKLPEEHAKLSNETFFHSLYEHIQDEEYYLHNSPHRELSSKDMFDEMEDFWHNKKDQLQTASLNKAIKKDLLDKIEELHNLEVDWQKTQLRHERIKDELSSKEILIENSIRHLKKSFRRLHLNVPIQDEHHFILSNGERLKSLAHLRDELRHMEDALYNYHVNDEKNDFSTWIDHVMGLKELAQDVRSAKNQGHMAEIIENWYHSH